MKTMELRIPLPMTVEEHQVGQMWSVNELSRLETGGGEGVQIVRNEPFRGEKFMGGKYTSGQYAYKIYHLDSKIPTAVRALLRPIVGKKGLELHEEAWNAYPYCITTITNPAYMKENFKITLESLHLPGPPDRDNVLDLSSTAYAAVTRHVEDIAKDENGLLRGIDPANFRSAKASRGPLEPGSWVRKQDPVMTCYKLVTVQFKWAGLQTLVETLVLDHYRKMLVSFYQQVWCWMDEWFGLSMSDIRRIESRVQAELEENIRSGDKRGIPKTDKE